MSFVISLRQAYTRPSWYYGINPKTVIKVQLSYGCGAKSLQIQKKLENSTGYTIGEDLCKMDKKLYHLRLGY